MAAMNVSATDSPLVSVAVTLRLSDDAVEGAVPVKVSVAPLNFNRSAAPRRSPATPHR